MLEKTRWQEGMRREIHERPAAAEALYSAMEPPIPRACGPPPLPLSFTHASVLMLQNLLGFGFNFFFLVWIYNWSLY